MNAPAQITEADERALLDSIDRWLTKKVAPVADRFEQADEYPHELVADMCEMGLFGALARRAASARRSATRRRTDRLSRSTVTVNNFTSSQSLRSPM